MKNPRVTLLIAAYFVCLPILSLDAQESASLDEQLPPHIERLTHFGQRADFSHDGQRILFMEKTFGDVFEIDLTTRVIRPLTHHYYHEGYTRALYLSNGDILLSGARKFDPADPWPSREVTAELWILRSDASSPPMPLGEYCFEGPAVSRTSMKIAWTVHHRNYPDRIPEKVWQIWHGEIVFEDGAPKVVNKKMILDNQHFPYFCELEAQSFRPPDEKELIFSVYVDAVAEAMGLDIESGEVINYTDNPPGYDEPEGIFPDGEFTLIESDRHNLKGAQYIDIYKLALDGSGTMERLTRFVDIPGHQATNPVVSDDGRFMAFQVAKKGEAAGVGRGLFLFDLRMFEGSK